ncbi:cobalamin B12-binding domain-containing protein [Chloroflexota bacterium]
MNNRRIRVLIAKPGLDGHDRGAKTVASALRDAGMEVIYTGIRQTPEAIINAAVQEYIDVLGLSILSGAHMDLVPEIIEGLKKNGLENSLVIVGGIIPEEDIELLKAIGVKAVFEPGTFTSQIVEFIRKEMNVN